MRPLTLSRDAVRDVDRRAIEDFGMSGLVLMENAGRGTADVLLKLGCRGPVVVCAGKGNNAGDGFVIARHLENHGIEVRVWLFSDAAELKGDAEINFGILVQAQTPVQQASDSVDWSKFNRDLEQAEWIVDALLGTGTVGRIRMPYQTVIEHVNKADGPRVLAVDLPSGLDCDTGLPLGCAVRADHTATMVARKIGFDAPGAADWTGAVHVVDIGIPKKLLASLGR